MSKKCHYKERHDHKGISPQLLVGFISVRKFQDLKLVLGRSVPTKDPKGNGQT